MEEPVKVFIRIRPPNDYEVSSRDFKKCTEATDPQTLLLAYPRDTIRPFHFDGVLGEQTSELEVYEIAAKQLISHVMLGYNGTFFVYGQTGTGKTHTMGLLKKISPKAEGIIPMVLKDIFFKEGGITVTLSFLQIYMENVYDLLKPDKKPLQVREDSSGGIFVRDLTQVPVENFLQAANLINAGLCNRIMGSHNANQTSSRSHIVLSLEIEQNSLTSRVTLIDLAGSERVGSTSSSGLRLDEAKFINTSLSTLGKVISALSVNNLSHIPYRDSKLTRLLQPFLNGKVVLVATVSPCYKFGGETLSTLQFASRCKQVICLPVNNEEETVDKGVLDLKRREEFLASRVRELETQNSMIFNHSHAEVIYYLVRLLSKVTQNSIKLTQEVIKAREEVDAKDLHRAEEKFPFPLTGHKAESDEEYMKDLFVKLDSLPSAQVVEKVQVLAKKLVDNMNNLGKLAVQGQYLKRTHIERSPSEAVFETMKREASEAVLQTKQKSVPSLITKPQVFKISEAPSERSEKLQKNLSLKELLRSKKSNQNFETAEVQVIKETEQIFESSMTPEALKKEKITRKIVINRSPISSRRVTVNKSPVSKELAFEKKPKERSGRVESQPRTAQSQRDRDFRTPPPSSRQQYRSPSGQEDPSFGAKADFLQDSESDLPSVTDNSWKDFKFH